MEALHSRVGTKRDLEIDAGLVMVFIAVGKMSATAGSTGILASACTDGLHR